MIDDCFCPYADRRSTGNPTLFPSSTDLIVGPGFKDAFVPAYPTVPDSSVDERLWAGRELVEVEMTSDFKIGEYDALDFFGDGSFYLLSTPGHAVGHMSGLARTSSDPPQFFFLVSGAVNCATLALSECAGDVPARGWMRWVVAVSAQRISNSLQYWNA